MKIMVIDDSKHQMKVYEGMLKALGHEAIPFNSAILALENIEKISPELVIVDLLMPDMHGTEFLTKIMERKLPFPVMVASGDIQVSVKAQCVLLDALSFVNKPITMDNLRIGISNALNFLEIKNLTKDLSFSNEQLSHLRDLLEDSTYAGAKKLSEAVGHEISLTIPSVKMGRLGDVNLGDKKNNSQLIGGKTTFSGNYSGEGFLLFTKEGSRNLLKSLYQTTENESSDEEVSDMLKEITNIVLGSALGIFSNKLHAKIEIKVPEIVENDFLNKKFKGDEKIILVESEFLIKNIEVTGNLIMLLNFDSLRHLQISLNILKAE